MSKTHEGGCLCGEVRCRVAAKPLRVTICHCSFCQKLTGSAYLVEPIFHKQDFALVRAAPQTYDHRSDNSQKRVTVNFCATCGTTLYLDLERFPDILGLCAGTFDDPNWFDRDANECRHIFTRSAQLGVVLPPGPSIFRKHAIALDGTPEQPVVLSHALMVSREHLTNPHELDQR